MRGNEIAHKNGFRSPKNRILLGSRQLNGLNLSLLYDQAIKSPNRANVSIRVSSVSRSKFQESFYENQANWKGWCESKTLTWVEFQGSRYSHIITGLLNGFGWRWCVTKIRVRIECTPVGICHSDWFRRMTYQAVMECSFPALALPIQKLHIRLFCAQFQLVFRWKERTYGKKTHKWIVRTHKVRCKLNWWQFSCHVMFSNRF